MTEWPPDWLLQLWAWWDKRFRKAEIPPLADDPVAHRLFGEAKWRRWVEKEKRR